MSISAIIPVKRRHLGWEANGGEITGIKPDDTHVEIRANGTFVRMDLDDLGRINEAVRRAGYDPEPSREASLKLDESRRAERESELRNAVAELARLLDIPTLDIGPKHLRIKIDDLNLSVRSANAMRSNGIRYVAELVTRTEADLLPTLGRKGLNEIKEALGNLGLELGM